MPHNKILTRAALILGLVGFAAFALGANGGSQLTGGGGLTKVVHDSTQTGSGTTASPLGRAAITGNVTIPAASNVSTIGTGVVTLGMMAAEDASTLIGNNAGGAATPVYLTPSQVRTMLALLAIATSASATDLTTGTLPAGRFPALTGPVTTTAGSVATTIAANGVTLGNIATIADQTILGNNTGGAASPVALTASQVRTALALASVATSASASDITGGTLSCARLPTFTGDVASAGGSCTLTIATSAVTSTAIAANAVTFAKMQTIADLTILGNNTGGTAVPLALTASQVKTVLAIATGDVSGLFVAHGEFGDGSDGALTADGTATVGTGSVTGVACVTVASNVYTQTRECFFSSLTIQSGKTWLPSGFPLHVSGTLTVTGDLNTNGLAAVTNAGGAAGWSAHPLPSGTAGGNASSGGGSSSTTPTDCSATAAAGGNGTTPTTGGNGGNCHGAGGGGGGPGNAGGSSGNSGGGGGTITLASSSTGASFRNHFASVRAIQWGVTAGTSSFSAPTGGGGGGAGGAAGAGAGGGGGGGAGWLVVQARSFSVSGTIRALGGACAVGSGATAATNGGGGGGGGGGAGGVIVCESGDGTCPAAGTGAGKLDVSGATGCGGGAAQGTGTNGAAGGNGGNGLTVIYN